VQKRCSEEREGTTVTCRHKRRYNALDEPSAIGAGTIKRGRALAAAEL